MVEGALTRQSRTPAVPPCSQRVCVVDAVAASQRGGDQRHYLVAGVGPPRRITQVQALLYQLGKYRGAGPRWPEGVARTLGHQAVVVEGDLDAVGVVRGSIYWVPPFLGHGFKLLAIPLSQNSEASTLKSHFRTLTPTPSFGGFGVRPTEATPNLA